VKVVLKETMLEKFDKMVTREIHMKNISDYRVDYILLTEEEAAGLYMETVLARNYTIVPFRPLSSDPLTQKGKAQAMHNGRLYGYTLKVEGMEDNNAA
jgi:hypothetical protein